MGKTSSCNNGGAESVLLAKFDDSGPGPDNAPFAIVCDTGGEVRAGHYAVGYEDLQINSGTKIEGTTFQSPILKAMVFLNYSLMGFQLDKQQRQ